MGGFKQKEGEGEGEGEGGSEVRSSGAGSDPRTLVGELSAVNEAKSEGDGNADNSGELPPVGPVSSRRVRGRFHRVPEVLGI